MITEIEDYFTLGCGRCDRHATPDCSTRQWSAGLNDLRRICLAAGLTETVKWGHPCYTHAGRNIAIIGAFRGDFRLNLFNAALLTDPDGVLRKSGPNARRNDMIAFADNAGPAALEPAIRRCLAEAMGHAAAGTRPPKDDSLPDWPEELVAALDGDPDLAEAFHALTPGRQKSHVLHLLSTQVPATRFARIARQRDRILAGKGANERFV